MPEGLKPILLAYLLLELLYRAIRELDDFPTSQTDQVIVVLMPQYVLVVAVPLAKDHLAQQAALNQQGQCSIDRRFRHPKAVLPHSEKEVFDFKVLVNGASLFQNFFSFRSKP